MSQQTQSNLACFKGRSVKVKVFLQASLADLNSKCPEVIPMNRFRPNIVVSGFEPWEEDFWQQLRLGSIDFDCTMPTGRCTVSFNKSLDTSSKSG